MGRALALPSWWPEGAWTRGRSCTGLVPHPNPSLFCPGRSVLPPHPGLDAATPQWALPPHRPQSDGYMWGLESWGVWDKLPDAGTFVQVGCYDTDPSRGGGNNIFPH